MSMATCYTSYDISLQQTAQQQPTSSNRLTTVPQHKDYSRPLHVDCSVEYELPSQAKPPPGSRNEPLLMIHPCYFRKMESQHRSPFVNNLPGRSSTSTARKTTRSSIVQQPAVQRNQSVQQRPQPNSQLRTIPQQIRQQQTMQRNIVQQVQQVQQPQQNYQNQQQYQRHPWNPEQQQLPQQQQQMCYKQPKLEEQLGLSINCNQTNQMLGVYQGTNDGGLWANTNHISPLQAERFPEPQVTLVHNTNNSHNQLDNKNITGKYRQYLRTHRLHPYMSMAATAFPQLAQMQQISCYNV